MLTCTLPIISGQKILVTGMLLIISGQNILVTCMLLIISRKKCYLFFQNKFLLIHNFVSVTLISVSVTCILEVAEIWGTETVIRVTETLLPTYLGNVTHIFGVTHILGYCMK